MELVKRSTDYAIRALVHLASREQGVESAMSIAEAEAIPPLFLQKIMQKFTKAGLVTAQVGAAGGLALAVDPDAVTMRQIIEITQGSLTVSKCVLGLGKCGKSGHCPLTAGWAEVQNKMDSFLDSITLSDLVTRAREAGQL